VKKRPWRGNVEKEMLKPKIFSVGLQKFSYHSIYRQEIPRILKNELFIDADSTYIDPVGSNSSPPPVNGVFLFFIYAVQFKKISQKPGCSGCVNVYNPKSDILYERLL
jgi:hypothetical protein